MKAALRDAWDRVWFRPAGPMALIAARVLVCVQALWILLSRPDLPDLARWPEEFWVLAGQMLPVRFGIVGLPPAAEWGLFVVLHLSLVAALLGLWCRLSCLVAALLLYHFAPFEEILAGMPHTAFGGLTLPTMALFVLSFAEAPRHRGPASPEYRWPLALIQLLLAFHYFFPALAKLRFSGLDWFTAENLHYYVLGNHAVTAAPLALWVARQPALCAALATGTLLLEVCAPLVVVSTRFAHAFLAAALAFHTGILLVIGYFFPSLPLLLLLVDWDSLGRRTSAPSA
ncbi:MAG TPA: hypothetical protein VFM88_19000 [Vicinamibacteria bacterium]|nr:hypothetical protein [Vicinamibacteria bacterium]